MLETRIAKELAYISQAGLARRITELYFVNPAQAQDRTGKTYLVLASNNYLGFTHAPEVIEAASRAALKFGTGSSGSRLTTGGTFIASELEKRLADFKHSESALVFNTGYMTNLGVGNPSPLISTNGAVDAALFQELSFSLPSIFNFPSGR